MKYSVIELKLIDCFHINAIIMSFILLKSTVDRRISEKTLHKNTDTVRLLVKISFYEVYKTKLQDI